MASKNDTPTADQLKGDVQEKADKEQAQGFVGTKVDPIDDAEYTLTTGPDSPRAVDDAVSGIRQVDVKPDVS